MLIYWNYIQTRDTLGTEDAQSGMRDKYKVRAGSGSLHLPCPAYHVSACRYSKIMRQLIEIGIQEPAIWSLKNINSHVLQMPISISIPPKDFMFTPLTRAIQLPLAPYQLQILTAKSLTAPKEEQEAKAYHQSLSGNDKEDTKAEGSEGTMDLWLRVRLWREIQDEDQRRTVRLTMNDFNAEASTSF